jgi:linoleoyl-CoA desaturase
MTIQQPPELNNPTDASRSATSPTGLKFGTGDRFYAELRRRVDQYFRATGKRRRDCPRMYLKTALVLAWFVACYVLLVFVMGTWWLAVPAAMLLGLSMAAIGFNIQHDGGHHAYSGRAWVNRLMAMSLDLLGGSSYIWARKHNGIHHAYANITGVDDDIDVGFFGRLSPHQKRLRFHRLQHFYMWPLYGFLPLKWQLYDDFRDVVTGHAGGQPYARPKGWDLAVFLGGKTVFFSLALAIPLLLHPVLTVLLFYLASSFVQGVMLGVVFQLAHCVEEASFPLPRLDTGRMETAWAIHQLETTVDFARRSRLLSWFVGGLNFQIEHHLFPQICHVNYPQISPLVEQTCREFGLKYAAQQSLAASIVSHFRWLRRMGMRTETTCEPTHQLGADQ